MTISDVKTIISVDGSKIITGLATGPADYDATNGSAMDVSAYFQTIETINFHGGCTAKADPLQANPMYINDDFDDADGGAVYFSEDNTGGPGVFANVTDADSLDEEQWRFFAIGTEVTR